jgi:Uma2 family endonuclease
MPPSPIGLRRRLPRFDPQHLSPLGLPTMYDLPSEDPEEPGLPDEFHAHQPHLLRATFRPPLYMPNRVFVAMDMNLYYNIDHPLWHKRPDWFAVLGVSRLYAEHDLRLSYVIWQERVVPYLVVELLSPGTEDEDLGETLAEAQGPPTKWEVYEQILGIPYYVTFSRYTNEVRYFTLVNGVYSEVFPTNQRLWLPEAEVGLGPWVGTHEGLQRTWLRFYDAHGEWIRTPEEQASQRAEQESLRAEQASQRAEQESLRANRLAARLRALGIDPDA